MEAAQLTSVFFLDVGLCPLVMKVKSLRCLEIMGNTQRRRDMSKKNQDLKTMVSYVILLRSKWYEIYSS